MAYQALYRTWRPEYFRDVVGQDRIVTTLVNQIKTGKISHAYLFCGSRGTGKTSTAKVFARAINCQDSQDGEPCGHCPACLALSGENNLDIVEMDAASNNGVDDIRDLRDKIQYPPTVGRYKVYIIDEVHMLSAGAFNALLKTLEEPPEYAVFILATTEPQKLLATILSRCQRFDFRRISVSVIAERLRKVLEAGNIPFDEDALFMIARAAQGGMRDALSILDMCLAFESSRLTAENAREVLGAADPAFIFDFAARLIDGDAAGALEMVDDIMRQGLDCAVFSRDVTAHMRALLLARTGPEALPRMLEVTAEQAGRYAEQAKTASESRILRLMELFMKAEGDMRYASSPRSVLELCAVRGCHPEREQGEDALLDRISVLEKAVAEGVKAAPAKKEKPAPVKAAAAAPTETKPAAGTQASPGEISAEDKEAFDRAVKLVAKSAPHLMMLLKKAEFRGTEGGFAVVAYDGENDILRQASERSAREQAVTDCFTQAFGREMALKIVSRDAAPSVTKEQKQTEKSNMDLIFVAFPRDKIEITKE